MPLKSGKSNKAFAMNVKEMLHKFKTTGTIGNSKPKDIAKARKQALAIAFSEQGK